MNIKKLWLLSVCAALISGACNPDRIDTRRVSQEIKDRKVRKITEAQIIEETEKRVQPQLARLEQLMPGYNCKAENTPLYDSLVYVWEAEIGIYPADSVPVGTTPGNEKLKGVAEAYSYSVENKLPIETNIQLTPDRIFYTRLYKGDSCTGKSTPHIWLVNLAKKTIIREIK